MHVLYVEDNPLDVLLLKKHLAKFSESIRFSTCENGEEALHILRSAKGTDDLPGIVITDINMPRMTGHEFLERIKKEDELRRIPVIVFSGSHSESDVALAYKHHASCYIVKPTDLTEYKDTIYSLASFWQNRVMLHSNRTTQSQAG